MHRVTTPAGNVYKTVYKREETASRASNTDAATDGGVERAETFVHGPVPNFSLRGPRCTPHSAPYLPPPAASARHSAPGPPFSAASDLAAQAPAAAHAAAGSGPAPSAGHAARRPGGSPGLGPGGSGSGAGADAATPIAGFWRAGPGERN